MMGKLPDGVSTSIRHLELVECHMIAAPWGKHITDDNIRDYIDYLYNSGNYGLIIEATPKGLLRELMCDSDITITPEFEDYVYKCVIKENPGICNQWGNVILPFLETALSHVLHTKLTSSTSGNMVLDLKTAIVSVSSYYPSCHFSNYSKTALLSLIEECGAYSRAKLPTRGLDCGRWGTRITPEGFSHVMSTVSYPAWRVCEIPLEYTQGKRCVMVVLPEKSSVQFFRMKNGAQMGGECRFVSQVAYERDANGDNTDRVSVFECIYDLPSTNVFVYDCSIADGVNVRQTSLMNRIKSAHAVLDGSSLCWPECTIAIANYVPQDPVRTGTGTVPVNGAITGTGTGTVPVTGAITRPSNVQHAKNLIDASYNNRVLFVKESAPLTLFPGGDAFVWIAPKLHTGMYVLTCRAKECMAVVENGNYLMAKVGDLVNPEDTEHMQAYACRLELDGALGNCTRKWRAIRKAKSSERLFTVQECSGPEYPITMVERDGMLQILNKVMAPSAQTVNPTPNINSGYSSAFNPNPIRFPQKVGEWLHTNSAHFVPKPTGKKSVPKPTVDEDGWSTVPSKTKVSALIAHIVPNPVASASINVAKSGADGRKKKVPPKKAPENGNVFNALKVEK